MATTEQHKNFAEKILSQAAEERGLENLSEPKEITKEQMPNRPPDYYITLPSGVRAGVWEEPMS